MSISATENLLPSVDAALARARLLTEAAETHNRRARSKLSKGRSTGAGNRDCRR